MEEKSQAQLDSEYEEWFNQTDFTKYSNKSLDELRQILLGELDMFDTMDVQEYTFHQKWEEIQRKFPTKKTRSIVDGTTSRVLLSDMKQSEIDLIKFDKLWIPKNPDSYLSLEPGVLLCDTPDLVKQWNCMRVFISSQMANNNIGRNLRYFVIDKVTGKYLGIFCISSDFMDLTPRDNYIGWSREVKTNQKMINHLGIGSTIVPIQPLGYNYLGGKLIALMTLSQHIQDTWKSNYGDVLAGMTTTSLYGTFSQYNNLSYWNKRGSTRGTTPYEPTYKTKKLLMDWLAHDNPRLYWEYWHALNSKGQKLKRDHKFRSLQYVYKKLDIPKEKIYTEHKRGIYFCPFYDNSCEFLRKEIPEEDLVSRFDCNEDSLGQLWKDKYASKRIKKLLEKDSVRSDTLFYDDIIYMDSFEEAKGKYLSLVGEGR